MNKVIDNKTKKMIEAEERVKNEFLSKKIDAEDLVRAFKKLPDEERVKIFYGIEFVNKLDAMVM
ncbi:hypothetical protein [Clostridioides sp. ES-S-0001-03]|uniref:hypothetical protein n=1 Tax=Clostridioides sp. ES-S-0001-03 TaxID=2770771 RepID=UPI001D0C03BA|nr:hypothetical protein [Clostridioides sp. ES-S-0001-03]